MKAASPQGSGGGCRLIPKWLLAESIVAGAGYNRWLFPPAALLVHFSIGQAYAYSVFNKPLIHLCHQGDQTCRNWDMQEVVWVFTMFFIFLGSSAAVFGRVLERLGPRFAGVVSAFCWGGGYIIAGYGVKHHNLALLYVGNGVIGGIGLGFGYLSPVSTLLKWFPDHPGMATGLAIGGFGGGSVIGSPLSALLLQHYPVWKTFMIMGGIYFVAIMAGALAYRVPPPGWKPVGWQGAPTHTANRSLDKGGYVDANTAVLTPQFWLLWVILCMNVSCGIGVLSQASPIVQDIFHGRVTAVEAAAIVGLFSLFNIGGRLFWSSLSDIIGRWSVYSIFFILGMFLYGATPTTGHHGNFPAFFVCMAIILSMYGGGFAAIPAYIWDIFGVKHAGAIHGRVLTAWSVAAVVGPYIFNHIRKEELAAGRPVSKAYDKTMYVLCGLLAIGLLANVLIPVANKFCPITRKQMTQEGGAEGKEEEEGEGSEGKVESGEQAQGKSSGGSTLEIERGDSSKNNQGKSSAAVVAVVAVAWAVPLVGFAWGLYMVLLKGIRAFK